MIGFWNDAEEDALQGLPHMAQLLYLRGIRLYVDKRTGLVGLKRGISWRSLMETVYVEPHQGFVRSGTPTKATIRRAAQWLIDAGLIEERSAGKKLIFFCPMAVADKSVKNKPGTNPAQTRHIKPGTEEYYEDLRSFNDLINNQETEPGTNPAQTRHIKPGTPHQSPYSNNSVAQHGSNLPRARVDRVAMLKCFAGLGFQHLQVHTPKVIAMIDRWVDAGITTNDVCTVLDTVMDRSGGKRPISPAYLDGPLSEYLQERNRQSETGDSHGKRRHDRKADKYRDPYAEAIFGSPDPRMDAVEVSAAGMGRDGGNVRTTVDGEVERQSNDEVGPGAVGRGVVKIR